MDVEKTIEFLLAHQARFSADMDQLKELQKVHEERFAKQEDGLAKLTEQVDLLTRVFIKSREEQFQVINALGRKIEAVAERVDQTTENVNALVKVVDGLVGRSNGGHKQ